MHDETKPSLNRIIVALSGGKASAWCADWALKNYPKEDVVLYFNDTLWEHPDLYRFLSDLERYWDHPITYDSDGRNPEELFADNHALANNRMPFCSRVLKAERLQSFYKHGDILVFGIGPGEQKRAHRIVGIYQMIATKTDKWCKLVFPLMSEKVTPSHVDGFLRDAEIEEPELYKLGFQHNNCSGGCVRQEKKQWLHLLRVLPDVYAERERVEEKMRRHLGKDVHYIKDETLKHLRERAARGELSRHYDDDDGSQLPLFGGECIGICEGTA